MEIPKRTRESMIAKFISRPGDVYMVVYLGGLNSSVTVRVRNEKCDEEIVLGFKNEIGTWKFLKDLDNLAAREVVVELEDYTTVPYVDSMPYKARF